LDTRWYEEAGELVARVDPVFFRARCQQWRAGQVLLLESGCGGRGISIFAGGADHRDRSRRRTTRRKKKYFMASLRTVSMS
jgi:hypothetical protein